MKGNKGAIAALLALVALSMFTSHCSARRTIDLASLIRGGSGVVSGGGPGDFCGSSYPCNSPLRCACVPIYPMPDVCTCQNLALAQANKM